MPGTTPQIFDRALRRRRLVRAARQRGEPPFLAVEAAQRLAERLTEVRRDFARTVEIAAVPGVLPAGPGRIVLSPAQASAAADAVTDAEILPLSEGSADLIVSVLDLHAVNDLPGALVQMRRALRPDGLLLAAMFGGETLTELRQALMQAESEALGGVSPRVFPFVDVRDAGALLQRAGFALPVADAERITVRYANPLRLFADLRDMGETNILRDRLRRPMPRRMLARALEIYAERFGDADGRVRATFDIVTLTGWAPHESQPKPLRPGSATHRLADVLGTVERPLKPGR
ncbi:MAG: methyltransferase domain-containing protein [Alphaproteobacteria bacterium]|nr:methyltransferase domain-containing protein [Alphaproteobacteria bacterium]MDX5369509.1 methyltransferase domain-containing protein [Alphaproteobacteria bacterium]MDX5464167.1 methyltransferase domain-containing protein [Alphaproteobacteria bacterium]